MVDNKKDIICPACGKDMTKVLLAEAGINIDICLDGCGGMLFDNRELEKVDEMHENANEILSFITDKTFETVDENAVRGCPLCETPMVKMGSGKGSFVIDVCNCCGAKYLDNKELVTMRNSEETEISEKVQELTESLYLDDLGAIIGSNAHKPNKPSIVRDFMQDLVFAFLTR